MCFEHKHKFTLIWRLPLQTLAKIMYKKHKVEKHTFENRQCPKNKKQKFYLMCEKNGG